MTQVQIASIELDTSIQCRANIDTGVVNDYAERMAAGDKFPAVELFGSKTQAWLGDGWHRVLAAKQTGALRIDAKISEGGRVDALRHALAANVLHGLRRTNRDKRRAVEIALREFPKMSSRSIAEMCGVSHTFVEQLRPDHVATVATSERIGQDGKEYPAPVLRSASDDDASDDGEAIDDVSQLLPPSNGMSFARMAIMDLEQIRPDDSERAVAFGHVREWLNARS